MADQVRRDDERISITGECGVVLARKVIECLLFLFIFFTLSYYLNMFCLILSGRFLCSHHASG
ncbi:uncharacterized protein BDW47DRAFT_114064 [Aspergillus candidus]|uniref:Uncharacterized protein n=1 Tax=Aspergillus candidus TaxID=41067 RepID=A0A2I2EYD0_ASPCN|nr:hypothetical protein BDW47DRAFT_114064 [Aspergillus candidus]PLB33396.1 hypothetical protein BDW47DRAFT_114064 [Aspergillus candidus]